MKRLINIVSLFVLLIVSYKGFSQDTYRTQNGNMIITGEVSDTIIKLSTKELLLLLNYEDAQFEMKMDKSTFVTGIDSLDKKLALMKYEIITFQGKLDIEYVNTNGHPPLNFEVEGVLSTNDNIIRGVGYLEHISNRGTYSCLLTIKFNLKIEDLGLNLEGIGIDMKEDIQVEVIQAILNKYQD